MFHFRVYLLITALFSSAALAGDPIHIVGNTIEKLIPVQSKECSDSEDPQSTHEEAYRKKWAAKYASKFCDEPYLAICADPDLGKVAREQAKTKFGAQVSNDAFDQTVKEFGLNPKYYPTRVLSDVLQALPTPEQSRFIVRYVVISNELLQPYLRIIDQKYTESVFPEIRKYVLRAIDDTITSQLRAEHFKRQIKKVELITKTQIDIYTAIGYFDTKTTIDSFIATCEHHGLADNATTLGKLATPQVLICPGVLASMVEQGLERSDTALNNAFQTVSHELGHFIDSTDFESQYEPLKKCIQSEYSTCTKPEALNKLMPEIVADYWAAESVANYLETAGKNFSYDEKLRFLKQSYSTYCGSSGENHPVGRFRIISLLRRNPRIHKIMGCKTSTFSDAKHGCTLTGPTAELLY